MEAERLENLLLYIHIFSLPSKKLCPICLVFLVIILFFIHSRLQLFGFNYSSAILIVLLLCFLLLTFYVSWRKQVSMDSKVNLPVQSVKN